MIQETLLRFENLEAGYNGRMVLRCVSGELVTGGRVAIIGPNGCGKSTLLRALIGTLRSSGMICLRNQDIGEWSAEARNRGGIGCVRQGQNVFPSLSARENLEIAYSGPRAEFEERVVEVLNIFPTVREVLARRAGLLSGGQRQGLAIAMVLMNRPAVLLLDEPLAGLSGKAAAMVMEGLAQARRTGELMYAVVEHRLLLIRSHVDEVWIMREGQIVHRTGETSILEDPETLAKHYQLV